VVTRYIADKTFSRVVLKNNPMIRDSLLAWWKCKQSL